MKDLRPLYDRVVVRQSDAESKTAGGIVIPPSAQQKQAKGEVIAVGKGKLLESGAIRPLDVKVGDHVLFERHGGSKITVDGEELIILQEDQILAITDEE